VGKVLHLKFKSTDGLTTIKKDIILKFVSTKEESLEEVEVNQSPIWTDPTFRGYKNVDEIKFKEKDLVFINYKATDKDKNDALEVSMKAKEISDEKTLSYLSDNNLVEKGEINFKLDYENYPGLEGLKLRVTFTASDGKITIQKDLTLSFVRTKVEEAKGAREINVIAPLVKIKSINNTGLVNIRFNQKM
jgi:hypothetical protein